MKINCEFHPDSTASLHLYDDGTYHCFGCGAHGKQDKLIGVDRTKWKAKGFGFKDHYNENVGNSLARISKLPRKLIRGVNLPFDITGYYIVYPEPEKYYIKRVWDDNDPNRYRSPKGHQKPIFKVWLARNKNTLLLIEGQLNALSAHDSVVSYDVGVVSPGAATDFNRPKTVEYCLQYGRVCIIVDKDAAGVAAALQLKQTLDRSGKTTAIYAMDRDLNEILNVYGKEAVKEEISKALAMLSVR